MNSNAYKQHTLKLKSVETTIKSNQYGELTYVRNRIRIFCPKDGALTIEK